MVDFPDPLTPVTQTSIPSGKRRFKFFRLFSRAPMMRSSRPERIRLFSGRAI
jgi:hypothetical protein